MNSAEILEAYRRDGYVVIKNAFSAREIEDYRARIQALPETERKGDVLSCASLRSVLFDARIVGPLKAILGPRLVYFGDSTIRWEMTDGTRAFHRDTMFDEADPSTTEYPVVRAGIYLQDHVRHSGGLKVRRGSYRHVFLGRKNFKRLFIGGRDGRINFASFRLGRGVNLATEPGDLVIWNLRTWHSGYAVRLKLLPWLCLNPRIERHVPRSWILPDIRPRGALFFAFGAPSAALEANIEHCVARPDSAEHWKHCAFDDPAIEKACAERGVELRRDVLKKARGLTPFHG